MTVRRTLAKLAIAALAPLLTLGVVAPPASAAPGDTITKTTSKSAWVVKCKYAPALKAYMEVRYNATILATTTSRYWQQIWRRTIDKERIIQPTFTVWIFNSCDKKTRKTKKVTVALDLGQYWTGKRDYITLTPGVSATIKGGVSVSFSASLIHEKKTIKEVVHADRAKRNFFTAEMTPDELKWSIYNVKESGESDARPKVKLYRHLFVRYTTTKQSAIFDLGTQTLTVK